MQRTKHYIRAILPQHLLPNGDNDKKTRERSGSNYKYLKMSDKSNKKIELNEKQLSIKIVIFWY